MEVNSYYVNSSYSSMCKKRQWVLETLTLGGRTRTVLPRTCLSLSFGNHSEGFTLALSQWCIQSHCSEVNSCPLQTCRDVHNGMDFHSPTNSSIERTALLFAHYYPRLALRVYLSERKSTEREKNKLSKPYFNIILLRFLLRNKLICFPMLYTLGITT